MNFLARCFRLTGVTLALLLWPGFALADLESDLERAWVGAWVVVQVEVTSDCTSFYTNNEVRGRRVTAKGSRRFAEGELARVDKLSLRSERLDLYLTVAAPVLLPRQDGPFTLYDERSCRIQLMVDIPRQLVRERRRDAVEGLLREVVERHETAAMARQSGGWNRRERDSYPAEYQKTLAQHAVWKAEETNRRLARVRQGALEQAAAALERMGEDGHFLAGFAAGVEAQRQRWLPGCGDLEMSSFEIAEQRPPRERGGESASDRAFRRGFRDGQLLLWAIRVARAVEGCFVPVPPLPR